MYWIEFYLSNEAYQELFYWNLFLQAGRISKKRERKEESIDKTVLEKYSRGRRNDFFVSFSFIIFFFTLFLVM